MKNGIFHTAGPRVFSHLIRSSTGPRGRRPWALIVGVLVLGVGAGVTVSQEQPQPVPPQQTGVGQAEQERQFDAQARDLEARRTELQRSLQQAQVRLQQLLLEQEQQRRAVQKELDEIRERLRDVENQLADLPRQRLRAKYLAALQTLEQARGKRQQAEDQAEVARLAEQDASSAVDRLRQLLRQMPPIRPEPAGGQPRPQPPADGIGPERRERQKADQRQEQELSQCPQALQKPAITAEQQGGAWGEARAEPDDTAARTDGLLQQLESLRGEIGRAEEQMKALAAQTDTTRETLNREVSAVRTDLQRMGRTLGRIEQEHLDARGDLNANVEKLRGHLEQMQQLCQTQRALNFALLQAHRSTVGSAAYW